MAKTCTSIQKSLGWYQGTHELTGVKQRIYFLAKSSLISARLATLLGVNFYEDLAECLSKYRVGAIFTLGKEPPKERNIIVFDDFNARPAPSTRLQPRVFHRYKQQTLITKIVDHCLNHLLKSQMAWVLFLLQSNSTFFYVRNYRHQIQSVEILLDSVARNRLLGMRT